MNLKVENISLAFGAKTILHETDLKIVTGQRYGLIAPNGAGKTTLLKYISDNKLDSDTLLVSQHPEEDTKSVFESVISANTKRSQLLE